jgi:glycerol uptake facilitator-like aquaporin
LAGFIGTFALIFISAGAVVTFDPSNFAAVAFEDGFCYAFGNESNSYVNPALTLGVVIAGEGKFSAAVLVFLAQLLGGAADGVALARV